MKLRHIEVFNAIITQGSVSAAAQYLHITQPTASKILQHAELQLGFQLFERLKGRLVPTSEAKILYEETRIIADKVDDLKKTTKSIKKIEQGQVRLASIGALGLQILPEVVVNFRKKNPGIMFEIQTQHYENLMPRLLSEEKDVGLAFDPPHVNNMEYIDMGIGEFVCIYSNNELDHLPDKINLKDIVNFPLVSIESSGPLGNYITQKFQHQHIDVDPVIVVQSYFMVLNFVAFGGGIAIVDEFTARSNGAKPVKYKRFDPPITFSIKALHLANKIPSKTTLEFLNFLKEDIQIRQIQPK